MTTKTSELTKTNQTLPGKLVSMINKRKRAQTANLNKKRIRNFPQNKSIADERRFVLGSESESGMNQNASSFFKMQTPLEIQNLRQR